MVPHCYFVGARAESELRIMQLVRAMGMIVALLLCLIVGTVVSQDPGKPRRSRASTFERKVSLKTEKHAKEKERNVRKADEKVADYVENAKRRTAQRIKAMEEAKTLSAEDRANYMREIQREEDESIALGRRAKGHDPLYEEAKRRKSLRMEHDVELADPVEVHPLNTIEHLHEFTEQDPLGSFFPLDRCVATLVIEAACDQCPDALAAFEEVTAQIAKEEYHLPKDNRPHRFAVYNVSKAPHRYDELKEHATHIDGHLHRLPIVLMIDDKVSAATRNQPQFVEYKSAEQFRSDLLHTMHRRTIWKESTFHDEDELMHCIYETRGDGVALAIMLDSAVRERYASLSHMIDGVVDFHAQQHIAICRFHTVGRELDHTGSQGVKLPVIERFHSGYNPDNASAVGFVVDEEDPDSISAEYFTFDPRVVVNTQTDRRLFVQETQRFRRWVESLMGKRHTSSGRRFNHVHRRQTYTTHAHDACEDRRIQVGDVVQASITARSVEHDHRVIFESGPFTTIAGDVIDGLPPYLHNVLVGLCPESRFEIFSPAHEGFHPELLEINVTSASNPKAEPDPNAGFRYGADAEHRRDPRAEDPTIVVDDEL
jgi:hypothetical protein